MTLTEKQQVRKEVMEVRTKTIRIVENFVKEQKIVENEYDKYFSEIKKYSNDFRLTKSVEVVSRDVNYRDENGTSITLDTIIMEYNKCSITYVGVLTNNVDLLKNVRISVEQHVTYGRSWSRNNKGFKLKLSLDYDNEVWYKSARCFVNKVNEHVESKIEGYKYQQNQANNKKIAIDYIRQKFSQSCVITHTGNTATITYANGVVVSLYFMVDDTTKEVRLTIKETRITSPSNQDNLINIVETLGKL